MAQPFLFPHINKPNSNHKSCDKIYHFHIPINLFQIAHAKAQSELHCAMYQQGLGQLDVDWVVERFCCYPPYLGSNLTRR